MAILTAVVMLIASSAQAQNLFVSDMNSGNIYEFAPNGTRSTFASGLNGPQFMACDSAGNLFEADEGSGNIYEFAPNGTRTTFASGLASPVDLAFEPVLVPEPSTWAILGLGAAGLVIFRRRK
jgi:hypothetical protein